MQAADANAEGTMTTSGFETPNWMVYLKVKSGPIFPICEKSLTPLVLRQFSR
jgi:hypothetical protein